MKSVKRTRPGGGFPAVFYTIGKALEVGPWKLWQKMRSSNACKTCAVGMGGQLGGMVNESKNFPEVCKKSLQAQVADMKGAIPIDFFERNDLSGLLALTPKQAEDAGRLIYPVVLRPGAKHFTPVSWETALDIAASAFKETSPDRTAFYSSGRSSNESAFILQSFARIYGTNNVMNCSYYCHQASGVGLKMTFGTGTATIELEDLEKCDLLVLLGANPASNHPRLMTQLANLRRRGGHIIVVNPIKESGLEKFHVPSQMHSLIFGSEIASLYIQPLAGGDVALLVGVLKALIERSRVDNDFLKQHTIGHEEALASAQATEWSLIEAASGVAQASIEEMASMIALGKAVIFAWAMGLTHHQSGVDNILALCNVALATANVGRPGTGLLPIRGHSNVQGIGSVGFAPAMQDGIRRTLETLYGKPLPSTDGYDIYSTIEAAQQGKLDVLFALGGNLWGSNPDSVWAADAMQRVKTTVYLSTKLNPGHFHGRGQTTLILPVLARDEEPQSTTQESMFNYVRLSDGGAANVKGQMRSESDIICTLANGVLGQEPVDWLRLGNHHEVRKLIAEALPGWGEIETIEQSRKEFTIGGRVFHTPQFPTATGKATMQPTPVPVVDFDGLRLITIRSEGQFNTVVYENADIYRGMPHRHCILISAADARKLGVSDTQSVTVHGEAGSMEKIEIVVGAIREGVVAMFYPESNVLIKGRVDPRSGTPSFKSAPVRIEVPVRA